MHAKIMSMPIKPVIIGTHRVLASTTSDGNLSFVWGEKSEVQANRDRFFASQGIKESDTVFIDARHTGSIACVSRAGEGRVGESSLVFDPFIKAPAIDADFSEYLTAYDGLLTFDKRLHIALLSADCVPLVVVDEETGLHGILHIGLLGLLNDITGTLADVLARYSVPASRLNLYFGPHISATDYDLMKSGMWDRVGVQALEKCPWLETYIKREGNQAFLDLASAVAYRLEIIGCSRERMLIDERTTAAPASEFFSHYLAKRNGVENGRFVTIID